MIEFLSHPWHWSVSGAMIAFVMFVLLWFGGEFGASSNLRTICAIGGAGGKHTFFDFEWKDQLWNLVFICSAILGGYLAITFIPSPEPVQVAVSTQAHLSKMGITIPSSLKEGMGFVPTEIFSSEVFLSPRNLLILIGGGFLVGFGARYAGGCTSGHAISGLSNLQLPSLIAVVGFFIGGLAMSWIILPVVLSF